MMKTPTRPKPGPVFDVRWYRQGGAPCHRMFYKYVPALRLATMLHDLGHRVEMYTSTTTWKRFDLPDRDQWPNPVASRHYPETTETTP